MTIKNFKVGQGLDLDGLVLTNSNGELLVNGNAIGGGDLTGYATENYVANALTAYTTTAALANSIVDNDTIINNAAGTFLKVNTDVIATRNYVINAIANSSVDLANSAGTHLDYNNLTDQLDVNSYSVANAIAYDYSSIYTLSQGLAGQGLAVQGIDGKLTISNTIATVSYVDSVAQGLDVKASVAKATTGPITLSGEGTLEDGQTYWSMERVLVKDQANSSENGIYIVNKNGSWLASDQIDAGAFTFVEGGANAGKGFVYTLAGASYYWTQFSSAGSFITSTQYDGALAVNNGVLSLNVGTGLTQGGNTVAVNFASVANAIAGTGITFNTVTGKLESSGGSGSNYISNVTPTFVVTNGQLDLSDTISISSVELTDSVANVTAASDVFGDASTSAYAMGSNQTVGTLPTGSEVADVFVTLKTAAGASVYSRTSKLTYVNTGDDAPTWTEYGIIVSGSFPATTVGFDSSGNIIVNVDGAPGTYSVKGVVTVLK
jgi:hypothetical protein